MVRTQIQLTEEQMAQLREISRNSNESIAAVIRRALDLYLIKQKPDRRTLYRQALTIIGKYTAGVSDVSVEHDRYLDEAFDS